MSMLELAPTAQSSWTVSQARAALLEHEEGLFAATSQIVEAMGRDDRISAVLETLVQGLLALPLEVRVSEDGDGRKRNASRDWFAKAWPTISPEGEVSAAVRWGVMLGVAYGTIEYPDGLGGVPRRKTWHPQWLRWDGQRRAYYAWTENAGEQEVRHGDGKWWLFEPYGPRGWMLGAVRSLVVPWLVRTFNWRDWARHNEVHGMPVRKAIVPEDASEEHKRDFFTSIRRLVSESTIKLPRDDLTAQARGYDLQLLESMFDGSRSFRSQMDTANTAIAVRLLGQNLTTEAGGGGSYAAGKIHFKVQVDRLEAIANALETSDRAGIAEPIAEQRWGSRELAPWPHYNATPAADHQAEAGAALGLGKALDALDVGLGRSGLMVDAAAMCERFGIPMMPRPGGPTGLEPGQVPADPNATRQSFDPRQRGDGEAQGTPLEAALP